MSTKTSEQLVREPYLPGEHIFFEGDQDFHFYIVESGQVGIFTRDQKGEKQQVATISEGESFGEFALLDRAPRSATATALIPTTVVKVSDQGFEELMTELPTWAQCMLKNFSHRIKSMNEQLKRSSGK